jgi:hypothetical protein
MSLLRLLLKEPPPNEAPAADPKWVKNKRGGYHKLLGMLSVELSALEGIGGVYALWHRGVRPAWLYVGATDNLGQSLQEVRDMPEILAYEGRGGVYVSWSLIAPSSRAGVVKYMKQACSPVIADPLPHDKDDNRRAAPIEVKLPG